MTKQRNYYDLARQAPALQDTTNDEYNQMAYRSITLAITMVGAGAVIVNLSGGIPGWSASLVGSLAPLVACFLFGHYIGCYPKPLVHRIIRCRVGNHRAEVAKNPAACAWPGIPRFDTCPGAARFLRVVEEAINAMPCKHRTNPFCLEFDKAELRAVR
jgi:hypothetical protein